MDRTTLRHGRRRFLQGGLALAGLGLLAGCGVLRPQSPGPAKIPRIGVLTHRTIGSLPEGEAFRQALRELGWIPNESARIEYRFSSSPEALAETVAELVGLAPDVIVADGNAHVLFLKSAAGTTPIVMANSRDPVAAGLVASLGRPGGNVTGLGNFGAQLVAKQLQLLRESLPQMTRVAVMWNPEYEGAIDQAQLQAAAAPLGTQLHFAAFRGGPELRAGIEAAAAARADALLVLSDLPAGGGFGPWHWGQVAEMDLPTVGGSGALARDGGALLSYGPSLPELSRRAATYVDKILRGADPADLPVEQPTTFDLVVNLTTARALGLTIPQQVLIQATEIIQ